MDRIGRARALVVAVAAVAALGACGRSTHVDRPSAQAPATSQPPSTEPAADAAVGSSASDLSATVDSIDNELKDSDSEASSADPGLSQDEGDPTK